MHVAYYRIFHQSRYAEFVNGAPTLLVDSEPALVVKKNPLGRLIIYAHYTCRDLVLDTVLERMDNK